MPQSKFPWTGDKEADELPTATPTQQGVVLQGVHIPQLTAAPTEADFNHLLTVLQTAGLLAAA